MLTKKYRPRKIGQVVGQPVACEVAKTIVRDPDKRNTSYLFHGPSGTGKSTIAWMLAKALCPSGNGIIHINAANDNGVEASRSIVRGLSHKNLGGGMRVYIVEEAQRITSSAQEIFLDDLDSDTLEDVIFIFTATEIGSFIKGFKTRTTYVKFDPIADEDLLKRLLDIRKIEGFDSEIITDQVIATIVANSNGSARQAIKLLEACSSVSTEKIALSAICAKDDTPEDVMEICRILVNPKRYSEYHQAISLAYKSSHIAEDIRRMICNYVNKCAVSSKDQKAHKLYYALLLIFSERLTGDGKYAITRMIMEVCLDK